MSLFEDFKKDGKTRVVWEQIPWNDLQPRRGKVRHLPPQVREQWLKLFENPQAALPEILVGEWSSEGASAMRRYLSVAGQSQYDNLLAKAKELFPRPPYEIGMEEVHVQRQTFSFVFPGIPEFMTYFSKDFEDFGALPPDFLIPSLDSESSKHFYNTELDPVGYEPCTLLLEEAEGAESLVLNLLGRFPNLPRMRRAASLLLCQSSVEFFRKNTQYPEAKSFLPQLGMRVSRPDPKKVNVEKEYPETGATASLRIAGGTATLETSSEDFTMVQLLEKLVEFEEIEDIHALTFVTWEDHIMGSNKEWVDFLSGLSEHFPKLEAISVGEQERYRHIQQSDLAPLLQGFPQLKRLRIRGADDLRLQCAGHEHLEELRLESTGLWTPTIQDILSLELPSLQTLVLWVGQARFGRESDVTDLLPLLEDPRVFPRLRHLAIANDGQANEFAVLLKSHPQILDRLESLDLSMGTMTDEGAEALLEIAQLRGIRLNLSDNYLSEEMQEKLREQFGSNVDLSYQDTESDWQHVSVYE